MNKSNTLFLIAGISGFIAGVLFAPNKGSVNRLKAKNAANKIANKALYEIEQLQYTLED
ncbi:YtxH domain-containing protein [Arcticibacterium luteifluviistationis]|uniref:YtxH domain-containing protein n=1 Tax=Arcticibacterium luteifluviistationis TaxID=1784714 RepID=A0A2Z4GGJ8_9BACT|nr:YtxH domain-containing protein [Arcticibacterium luteifluviistationis]AWW00401.1 hypothetical protein DJ013_20365 [Arcticibacterium luteifluviistationis]